MDSLAMPRRPRSSAEERAQWVSQYHSSQVSAHEFAQQHQRYRIRQEQAPAIWEGLKKRAEELKPQLLPKSTLGQAGELHSASVANLTLPW